jgi:uncharacterized protein (TIGR02145 family)
MKKSVALMVLALLCVGACEKTSSFKDKRDSKKYKSVKIGEQVWMAENLNYAVDGSVCYDNDSANCETYGRLYNWEAARVACPTGWHLPSDAEWDVLIATVEQTHGPSAAGKHLKAANGWNGLDTYGFAVMPGGYGSPSSDFNGVGGYGNWWSDTEGDAIAAWFRNMRSAIDNVDKYMYGKDFFLSVRCVKGNAQ